MKHRVLFGFFLALAILNITGFQRQEMVLGVSAQTNTDFAYHENTVKTKTAFDQKIIQEYESIPFETVFEENDEMEYGTQETLQVGENGLRTLHYLLTYWQDEEIDKQLVETEIDDPIPEIISEGTKIIWRLYPTNDVGRIWYWHKMRVWATKYDANCIGCTGRTYSGTEVKKGVCAVDPKVIPLGTNFYVDRYGLCRAEDIGGAIKGNKIDLGFVNASEAAWGAEYTDIYILTNAPDGSTPNQ